VLVYERLEVYPQVVTEASHRLEPAPPKARHGRRASPGKDGPPVVASEKSRRDIQDITVHEAEMMELGSDVGAALHEQLQDVSASELVEHTAEITLELEGRKDPGTFWSVAEHHPERLAWPGCVPVVAHGEIGVIKADRRRPDEHGVALGSQFLDVTTRLGSGDPFARAVRCRRPAVQGDSQLQDDVRASPRAMYQVRAELTGHFVGEDAGRYFDARCPQRLQAATSYLRVWVADGDDNTGDPGCDQRIGARRGPSMVRTRLEGHISDRSPRRLTRGGKCRRLRVGSANRCRRPLPHDRARIADDDTTHPRVRGGRRPDALGKLDCPLHVVLVTAHSREVAVAHFDTLLADLVQPKGMLSAGSRP